MSPTATSKCKGGGGGSKDEWGIGLGGAQFEGLFLEIKGGLQVAGRPLLIISRPCPHPPPPPTGGWPRLSPPRLLA